MKVAITGATGFIGTALVDRLLAGGHEVTALSRDPARAAKVLPVRCRCEGWAPERGLVSAAIGSADAVVHLAGAGVADQRWSPERKRLIHDSRVGGTRAVVEALRSALAEQRPKALISASAIGYYGDRGDEPLSEESAAGDDFLARVCVDWEAEARRAEALGVRTAIIRIGIVLDRGGGALAPLLPLFRLGGGGRVGSGQQWMSWIHRRDLVRLFEHAITHDVEGVINGVAPAPVTNADFTRELANAIHRPALLPAPAMALRLALGELSTLVLASQRVSSHAAKLGFAFEHETLPGALAEICADDAESLQREQWLPAPADAVFSFFSDARNLEKITPDTLRFQVTGMQPASMGEGTLIDYRLRLHGLPVRWQSRIEEWLPNQRFVDVQTKGPYALWHHTHEFEPYDGGTIVRDRVRYRLPLGTAGKLVGGAFVGKDLENIFAFRRQKLEEIFPRRRSAAA